MDADKRRKLIEVKYEIKCCGVCAFADIAPLTDWGTCDLHTYNHEKHTESVRNMSINRHGICPAYTRNEAVRHSLGGFAEFLE